MEFLGLCDGGGDGMVKLAMPCRVENVPSLTGRLFLSMNVVPVAPHILMITVGQVDERKEDRVNDVCNVVCRFGLVEIVSSDGEKYSGEIKDRDSKIESGMRFILMCTLPIQSNMIPFEVCSDVDNVSGARIMEMIGGLMKEIHIMRKQNEIYEEMLDQVRDKFEKIQSIKSKAEEEEKKLQLQTDP